jgi:hypothetical protein
MPDKPSLSLNYPPFPRLVWEDPFWIGRATLASWQAFQPAYESDATLRRRQKAAGPARLTVVLPDQLTDEGVRAVPSPEQAAAYGYLVGHESAVHAAVLRAVLRAYPEIRESIEFWPDDEAEEEAIRNKLAPQVRRPAELASLIGLREVHVLPAVRSRVAYLGFEFDCTWDGEHGLGVLTHKGRVVEVGGGDTAFDNDAADADA